LLSTRLIVVDEIVLVLTLWVASRVSLTLGWIADMNQWGPEFGGRQLVFVGNLLPYRQQSKIWISQSSATLLQDSVLVFEPLTLSKLE
jgi:hypothetical protein